MNTRMLMIGASLLALHCSLSAGQPADYVAHEWGTFTSVQGADGVQLEWNPLLTTELPKFVYNRSRLRPGARPVLAGKTALVARQRLETPVIYFYSKQEQVVDVSVAFPQGSVTEWYPQQNPLPRTTVRPGEPAARWQQMRILAPGFDDTKYPREAAGSHYYAARVPDANAVQIKPGDQPAEVENFLFYRGVGHFQAPLRVTQEGANAADLRLTNTGAEPLSDLFVCDVRMRVIDGISRPMLAFAPLAKLEGQATQLAPRPPTDHLADQSQELAARLRSALARHGLYPAEAAAMVKTWEDSWLAEPGLRVLYVLPRAWADRVLPLTLEPAPRETARVMVGRAELITPRIERELTEAVDRFREGDELGRSTAVSKTRNLGLGRFAEPAIRRLALARPQDRLFNTAAWELLYAAFAPAPQPLAVSR